MRFNLSYVTLPIYEKFTFFISPVSINISYLHVTEKKNKHNNLKPAEPILFLYEM